MSKNCPECHLPDVEGDFPDGPTYEVFICPDCNCYWDEDGEILEHGTTYKPKVDDMGIAHAAMENEGMK